MFNFARFTAALALAGAILSTPAHAAAEPRSVVVRIADLDRESASGRATLMRRIDHAASAVCGQPDRRDLTASRLAADCHASALEDAMPQVQLALSGAGPKMAVNVVAVRADGL